MSAILTRTTWPWTSWPLSSPTSFSASAAEPMVTKPKPRLRPVSRSVIRCESSHQGRGVTLYSR